MQRNKFDDAIQILSSAIKINPFNSEAHLLRGQSFWNKGYVSRAESDFNAHPEDEKCQFRNN